MVHVIKGLNAQLMIRRMIAIKVQRPSYSWALCFRLALVDLGRA